MNADIYVNVQLQVRQAVFRIEIRQFRKPAYRAHELPSSCIDARLCMGQGPDVM